MDPRIATIVEWIKWSMPEGLGVIIPVSGGTDSALTFWFYNQVMPERTVGVFFGTDLRSEAWFTSVGTIRKVDAPSIIHDPETSRWLAALDIAIKETRVLVGTRNKTEDNLGTYSNASRLAFHLPLLQLWKTTILELCALVGVPDEVIRSSSDADPVCGRPETLAKIPFDTVDTFLAQKLSGLKTPIDLNNAQIAYLEDLYKRNSFKKYFPLRGPALA